jgi:NAD(P)-dependent dehydrogenase (short-subunit alcohol dehydrogenase family)
MNRFDGKTVLVTGGGGSIGSAIVRRLIAEGAAVVVMDVRADNAESVAAEVRKGGGKAVAVGGNILSEPDIAHALATTEKEFGPLDVLVNNAGGAFRATIAESNPEDWDAELNLTLKGAFMMSRAVLPAMVKRHKGVIVNIGSVNGLKYFGNPAYSAGKAGLFNLTQSIATEYGKHGVRCAMVSPGTIRTNAESWTRRQQKDPKVFEKLARWYPVGRVGLPDDIAAAVAYLASDDAAFVSGSNLIVDGGLTAGIGPMVDELLLERDDAS